MGVCRSFRLNRCVGIDGGSVEFCVIPIITLQSYRIEIFCFTHPSLLLGKFHQKGGAASATCFNTAFSTRSLFFNSLV